MCILTIFGTIVSLFSFTRTLLGAEGSSTGEMSSTLDAGCGQMRLRALGGGGGGEEASHACTRNRHSSPKMVVLSQKGQLRGSAHTPQLADPLKVEDNPLARPRFDHFHSLFLLSLHNLPRALSLSFSRCFPGRPFPGKYNFSPLGSCRRHRTPFCVSLGVTVMDDVCDNRRLRD